MSIWENGETYITTEGIETVLPDRLSEKALKAILAGDVGKHYRMLLGTIRNLGAAGGYWQPINDTAHKPSGIASVTTDSTGINVVYGWNGKAIGTVIAVTDETMASEGYLLGASVAANQCTIRLSRRKTFQDYVYWDVTLNGGAGGFRSVNNAFTVSSYAAGVLTLTHPSVYGNANNVQLSARGGAYRPVVSTAGAPADGTTTKIEFWTAAGALATVGHADMKAYVVRNDTPGVIDPRSAIDATSFPNHNIWLFGVMEV